MTTNDSTYTGEASKRPDREPLPPLDANMPIFVVMDQHETYRMFQVFNGPDAEKRAHAEAERLAVCTHRPGFVLKAVGVAEVTEVEEE